MKRAIFFVCLVFCSSPAHAETGVQFAAPGLNLPADPSVSGLRVSFLHGKNQRMRGLDLGILSVSETSSFSGLAFVGGISRIHGSMSPGACFSLVNYHSGNDSGVNGAFVNLLNDSAGAFTTGFVIIAKGTTGVDLGGFNMSASSTAQVGFINITKRIKSFQFGFVNMAENGFLPIFPVFNFPKQ